MLAPMLGLNSFEIRNNTHTHIKFKVQSTKYKDKNIHAKQSSKKIILCHSKAKKCIDMRLSSESDQNAN